MVSDPSVSANWSPASLIRSRTVSITFPATSKSGAASGESQGRRPANRLQRQPPVEIPPFLGRREMPDQYDFIDRAPNRHGSRHYDQAGAFRMLDEVPEVSRHGARVVRYQNTAHSCREREHFGILHALRDDGQRKLEANFRFGPKYARDNTLVEVGVRQESKRQRLPRNHFVPGLAKLIHQTARKRRLGAA